MLSNAHSLSLTQFLKQMREHRLEWTRSCSSKLFEGANVQRGAVISRSHPTIKSTCWIRRLILLEGSWAVIEGADKWVRECKTTTSCEQQQLSQRLFVDAFAPICIFVEPVQDLGSQTPFIRTWGWARVCVDIVQFNLFGHLLPVGTYNLCTDIVAIGPIVDRSAVPKRILNDVQHRIQVEGFCDFFVQHADQSIYSDSSSESVESIRVTSPDAILNFSSSSSSQSENPNFYSSSSDSPMHFTVDDIPLDEETPADILQMKRHLMLIFHFPLPVSLQHRDEDQKSTLSEELDDFRKELQDQKAAITNDLLEFRVESQQNFATLSTQLSEIISYINRVRDDKKGEVSSSRGPQPPDDRSKPGPGDSGRGRGSSSEPSRKRGSGYRGGESTSSRGFRYWLGGS
ncbi:hypothetical protein F511_41905 [Dorcoceras hygrometricum]|uniref:Uncharacterized protein n=1 Tax=Dorcoceras hygrometricum TaxID=472368 RepID=A0A2Z7CA89_9LAMI|nr:hypothetical protein F511_41905 [Dorcoceras hygrometricum]